MTLFPGENQPRHKCEDRHFGFRWFLPQSHPWARLESRNIYPSIIGVLWDPLRGLISLSHSSIGAGRDQERIEDGLASPGGPLHPVHDVLCPTSHVSVVPSNHEPGKRWKGVSWNRLFSDKELLLYCNPKNLFIWMHMVLVAACGI